MGMASKEVLDGMKDMDTATLFNAVVAAMGGSQGGFELEKKGGMPVNYTDNTLRCLLPELGIAAGYAVTMEVTTNDPDSSALKWDEYYDMLAKTPGPKFAIVKDVDSKPGRGASFGDGMAATHKLLGVTGAAVDGSVRDLMGIKKVGLPMWGKGLVPGHGIFNLISVNRPIVACGLLVKPGDFIVADMDGITKVPLEMDLAAVLKEALKIRRKEGAYHEQFKKPGATKASIDAWWKANKDKF
ncbi:MAG: RraA family protein [SAR202 cluster bacterium]|nr:RraA family protein [SAR202 cluster bacterium]